MKKNIGAIDAVIRADLAFVLGYLYYSNDNPSMLLTIGLIVAGHLLATAVFGNDPLYKLFNLSTNRGVGKCNDCDKDKNCPC
jgi:hypothetical protein